MPRNPRLTETIRGKALVYLGAGLALAGAGTATAVAGFSAPSGLGTSARYNAIAPATTATTTARHANLARQHPNHGGHGGHAVRHADAIAHPASHSRPAARVSHHGTRHPGRRVVHHAPDTGWGAVSRIVASHTVPLAGHGPLPAADRLTPVGTSGPQAWLPITTARWDNARTIVRQVLDKKMGLRAAVIAVATSLQESTLLNIDYGDRDSLGLFQQRPSTGWGTPSQILHPRYAADAFLDALRSYQSTDPYWAHQPLWESAEGVQDSGFPYAYAKWEAQAAQLVAALTKHLV